MNKNNNIRCRFAPSPTGSLHLGGARTALFNYLFAKAHNGQFILRIEDTDTERNTEDARQAIFDGLNWLNLSWDEGPFYQSERLDLYSEYARKLLALGYAYPCTCTSEDLDKVRSEQSSTGTKPQYNRKHRPQEISPQSTTLPSANDKSPFVIRLRAPITGDIIFNDLVLGEIITPAKEIDDFVIVRSNGAPTYNFTVVVDDIEMKISHVIRGMDHVSNTPKQIAIYQALGSSVPEFAHVPMILGEDKKKLSKRHGATSVIEYRQSGYLPDAFINYLARLGWSHGDQEVFSREELEKYFSLGTVGKSPAVFDFAKLLWVNAEHLKTVDIQTLVTCLAEFIPNSAKANLANPDFIKLIESLRERSKTLKEMAENCLWYFIEASEVIYDEKSVTKHLTSEIKPAFSELIADLEKLTEFNEHKIEEIFKYAVERFGVKLGKIAQAVRVSITGVAISPPIYTVLEILGKEESLKRLKHGLTLI
jgi:glutamyl-tRNA synthetase